MMKPSWKLRLLAGLLATGCLGAAKAPKASDSYDDLLMLSSRDSVFEVWGMEFDGSRPMRLVPKGGAVSEAHWSPQGDRIAFVAIVGPYSHVFVRERASGEVRQLTSGDHVNSSIAFSPNGQRLAFVSTRDGNSEIYTMRVDGGEQTRLTDFLEDDAAPAWSPNGQQIAFLRSGDRRDVWVMNSDGNQARNLTGSPKVDDTEPLWSPDGARILFGTRRNDSITISSIAPDGSDRKTLISNDAFNHSLAFSPNGRMLTWVSNTGGKGTSNLWIADSDGSQARALTTSTREDMNPAWSRDSQRVYFTSTRTVRPAIFSVAADGSDLQQLTWAIGQDLQPRVRPLPGRQFAGTTPPPR